MAISLNNRIVLFLIVTFLLTACAINTDRTKNPITPPPGLPSTSSIIVSDVSPGYRPAPRNIAVFVTTMDQVLTTVLEEVIELNLHRQGYGIISQDQISTSFNSLLKNHLINSQDGKSDTQPPPNSTELAETAGADLALVVTVLTGRQQNILPNKPDASIDQIVVTNATVRLLDVKQKLPLLSVSIDIPEGFSINQLVQTIVDQIAKPQSNIK